MERRRLSLLVLLDREGRAVLVDVPDSNLFVLGDAILWFEGGSGAKRDRQQQSSREGK